MNKKKTTILLAILAGIVMLISCQNKSGISTDKQVSVSIIPQKFIVERITDNRVSVNVLVPPGAKPETYALLPSQMKNLTQSKIWLLIGHIGFETAWKEKISEINPQLEIVDCSEGINLISHEEKNDTHEHGIDPHVWMAPSEMKQIVQNSLHALIKVFPEEKATFESNAALLLQEIDSLDQSLHARLDTITHRAFMIFHPGLTYFAREFNLVQIPLEIEGKEPSPRYMKEIVDIARSKKITTIFIQKEFDQENALQLAKEINGKVVPIDPLAYSWTDQMLKIGTLLTHKTNL